MAPIERTMNWFRDRPRAADAILALVLLAVIVPLLVGVEVDDSERDLDALAWVLLVVTTVPVAFRRSHPIPALWTSIGATTLFWVRDYPDDPTGPAILVLLYSVAAHVERPRSIHHGLAAITLVTSVLLIGILWPSEDLPWVAIPANLIVFGTAWILGDNMRNRRAYLAELEHRAKRSEERRAAEAREAVQAERSRIARELHDVVAHSMSVMVVQAGAARRIMAARPDQASEALENIERTGRESLDEMRRILGVLRSDDDVAEMTPAPDLSQLDQLTQQCEEAGLPVEVTVEGSPRPLTAGLELSVYRIVQESLTNALKHAGNATAEVRLSYLPEHLEVEVLDDGRGAAAGVLAGNGAHQGLVGMRERVEAYGGTLHTGPRSGGGFVVKASFPVGAHS